jgi:hypothetical protein
VAFAFSPAAVRFDLRQTSSVATHGAVPDELSSANPDFPEARKKPSTGGRVNNGQSSRRCVSTSADPMESEWQRPEEEESKSEMKMNKAVLVVNCVRHVSL